MNDSTTTQPRGRRIAALVRRAAAFVLAVAALVPAASPARAQLVSYEAAALEASWYAPDLGLYERSADYRLAFSGSVLTQVHLDFAVLRLLTLRASVGHWQQQSHGSEHREGTLRIVPMTATLLYSPAGWGALRPVVGGGIVQNLIQRSFQHTDPSGTGEPATDGSNRPLASAGNGRDFTYHALLGVHARVRGPVWSGIEWRYVWGGFQEQEAGGEVRLDGLQLGVSIRYHVR